MAAKDYKICCALFNAYIAKTSKRNKNQMLEDRREITDGEILMLFDWYLDKFITETDDEKSKGFAFDSNIHEGKRVKVTLIDKEEK